MRFARWVTRCVENTLNGLHVLAILATNEGCVNAKKRHMSQDTRPSKQEPTTASVALDEVSLGLPSQCAVPGYWKTLAENASDWAPVITVSPLWRKANEELDGWKREYRRTYQGTLYKGETLPSFVGKSEARIREKTLHRIMQSNDSKNEVQRLFDQSVPVPRLQDLVRVRLITQFLDGVPFLARKVFDLACTFDKSAQMEPKGELSGYFAQHVTFLSPVHFRFNGDTFSCSVVCEVQVATSLATHVWENSHALYEATRVRRESPEDWQWDPKDPRFLSRKLGHVIHLADGLFCNLRDGIK